MMEANLPLLASQINKQKDHPFEIVTRREQHTQEEKVPNPSLQSRLCATSRSPRHFRSFSPSLSPGHSGEKVNSIFL